MKRYITGFAIAVTAVAAALALAAPPLMAMPGPAAARDCSQIEDRNARRACVLQVPDVFILQLDLTNCARRLTENALITLGSEMGFTAKTTPAEIVTAFSAHPERQAQRLEQALSKAAERFRIMLESLVMLDDDNEREALTACVEMLSYQGRNAVIEERPKPPTAAPPVDLDWLDGVLAGLDEPPAPEAAPEPEPPPAPVELGVDCTEPFTVSLPDDVLTECE